MVTTNKRANLKVSYFAALLIASLCYFEIYIVTAQTYSRQEQSVISLAQTLHRQNTKYKKRKNKEIYEEVKEIYVENIAKT